MKKTTVCGLLLTVLAFAAWSNAAALEIKLPDDPGYNAKLAAEFLKEELPQSAPGEIKLVQDKSFADEAWKISGDGKCVTITAGRFGFTIGALYYLEDVCGYYRFSATEKQASDDAQVKLSFPEKSGKPAFFLRDLFYFSAIDGGRTAVRRGMNSEGDYPIKAKNSGRNLYGSPKFCHTFHLYFPQQTYFKNFPEWFSELNGKRTNIVGRSKTQLCLSNPELRDAWFGKMICFIAADRAKAKRENAPYPIFYDVSMNDAWNYCTCANCNALAAKYNNIQSGVTLDFVNDIAARIEKLYPEIIITTFAYYYNEVPPQNIRPRDNVMIVLCDTLSNTVVPVDHPDNATFMTKLKNWSAISKQLRIWDYNINFSIVSELPYNSEDTFQKDLQIFRKYKVSSNFIELEAPDVADVREYKMFLKSRLLLNPDEDVESLKRRFATVYYGKAGTLFLQYRALLKASQEKHQPFIDWVANPIHYSHLDFDTVKKANELFDAGEKLLAGDAVRLRRWNFARLSLDRAMVALRGELMKSCVTTHGSLKPFDFDYAVIKARITKTVSTRLANSQDSTRGKVKVAESIRSELAKLDSVIPEKALYTPEKFKNVPADKLFDYPCYRTKTHDFSVYTVADPDATSGIAVCYDWAKIAPKAHKYLEAPFLFGVYSWGTRKTFKSGTLKLKDIKPGYNWYKLCTSKIDERSYFFFLKSWDYQQYLPDMYDKRDPDARYTFYIRLKVTGEKYGFSGKEPSAVYIDRVVAVKEDKKK